MAARLLPFTTLFRSNGKFDLVAGRARSTPQGYKKPISGLPDGFGNPFNAHFWRQSVYRNAYFVGTNDWSYARSEEHTSELQSRRDLVCRLLLEIKN